MVELVTTVIITASSTLLFVYWVCQLRLLLFPGGGDAAGPGTIYNVTSPGIVTKSAVQ